MRRKVLGNKPHITSRSDKFLELKPSVRLKQQRKKTGKKKQCQLGYCGVWKARRGGKAVWIHIMQKSMAAQSLQTAPGAVWQGHSNSPNQAGCVKAKSPAELDISSWTLFAT